MTNKRRKSLRKKRTFTGGAAPVIRTRKRSEREKSVSHPDLDYANYATDPSDGAKCQQLSDVGQRLHSVIVPYAWETIEEASHTVENDGPACTMQAFSETLYVHFHNNRENRRMIEQLAIAHNVRLSHIGEDGKLHPTEVFPRGKQCSAIVATPIPASMLDDVRDSVHLVKIVRTLRAESGGTYQTRSRKFDKRERRIDE